MGRGDDKSLLPPLPVNHPTVAASPAAGSNPPVPALQRPLEQMTGSWITNPASCLQYFTLHYSQVLSQLAINRKRGREPQLQRCCVRDRQTQRRGETLALDVYSSERGNSVCQRPQSLPILIKNNDSDSAHQEHNMTFSSKPWSGAPTQTQKH